MPNDDQARRDLFQRGNDEIIGSCIKAVEMRIAAIPQSDTNSRLRNELPLYFQTLQSMKRAIALTFDEWQSHVSGRKKVRWRHAYVVCSSEQARMILDAGPLRIPIVVPRGCAQRLDIPAYLDYLSTKPSIDVHTWTQRCLKKGDHVQPKSLPAKEAIALFKACDHQPVNFLNLDIYKENEIPDALVGLKSYSVLRDLRNVNQSGKRTVSDPHDLSSCISFQILAKAGTFSFAHRDHVWVTTTATTEGVGYKLWVLWPELTAAEARSFESGSTDVPDCAPFAISLEAGDVYYQPPGRYHAPYSPTDVLMTGTMHWNTRELHKIAEAAVKEMSKPHITNEDVPEEILMKLDMLAELWKANAGPWPWPEMKYFSRFETAVEQLRRAIAKPKHGVRS